MIAITNGQRRRRWINRARVLAATIPLWMWVASLLVSTSGVFVNSDSAASEGCTGTCCGCGSCLSLAPPCAFCTGDIPTTFTMMFLGVENASSCLDCTASIWGNFGSASGESGTLGTYTVTQGVSPFVCRWTATVEGSTFKWLYDGFSGACADPVEITNISIILVKADATHYEIGVETAETIFATHWSIFHTAVDVGEDCCTAFGGDNDITTYTCDGAQITDDTGASGEFGDRRIGKNGSVAVVAC